MIEYVRSSIDRLTILASCDTPNIVLDKLKKALREKLDTGEVIIVEYDNATSFGIAWCEYDVYGEGKEENLIFCQAFQKGQVSDIRIDFNPNSLVKHGVEYVWTELKYLLKLFQLDMRLSRFDLAFDIINAPEISQMQNIRGGVTRKEFYGRSGALETIYWGSQASAVQIRLYDKKTELGGILGDLEYAGIETDNYGAYKIQIQDLWRLELQMRTKAIDENLAQEVEKRLDEFFMGSPYSLNLSPELRLFAGLFLSRPGDVSLACAHVPERTVRHWKSQVRKAVREANDEYVQEIKKALQRDTEKLKAELKKYCDIYLGF